MPLTPVLTGRPLELALARLPCRFRGEPTVVAQPIACCTTLSPVQLYACPKHHSCCLESVIGLLGVRSCNLCPDRPTDPAI